MALMFLCQKDLSECVCIKFWSLLWIHLFHSHSILCGKDAAPWNGRGVSHYYSFWFVFFSSLAWCCLMIWAQFSSKGSFISMVLFSWMIQSVLLVSTVVYSFACPGHKVRGCCQSMGPSHSTCFRKDSKICQCANVSWMISMHIHVFLWLAVHSICVCVHRRWQEGTKRRLTWQYRFMFRELSR